MPDRAEQRVLKRSIAVTIFIGASGVLFGVLSGSLSIAFDGMFSVVDAAMTFLALIVARLIARETSNRFQMGFWHIEPMVLAFNGALLSLLSLYAFVNAVGSLLSGGRVLVFDWAIGYAVITVAACLSMFVYVRRANRAIGSELLALDVKGWAMSGLITAALLLAFIAGYGLQGGPYARFVPYLDPAILAVLAICLVPIPLKTVYSAVKDIFLVAPADLDRHVREVAEAAVARHAMSDVRTYVAKVGRSRLIEVHFIVPATFPVGSIARLDAIREEVGAAIGGSVRDRWLTIVFTGDPKWAD